MHLAEALAPLLMAWKKEILERKVEANLDIPSNI
jgi:hypothetical protein